MQYLIARMNKVVIRDEHHITIIDKCKLDEAKTSIVKKF